MTPEIFDIIILIFLGISAVMGFFKGLITMVSSLLAIILGAWVTMKFSYLTGEFLQSHFNVDIQYVTILAFVLTFLAVVFGVNLLGKIVSKLASAIALGAIDKIAGAIFGALKTAFILSAIISALTAFAPTANLFNTIKADSKAYNIITPIAPFVFGQLNFNFSDYIPSVDDMLPEEIKTL